MILEAAALLLGLSTLAAGQSRYLGRDLGALSELNHGVKGRVFAVDSRTLFIRDLHFDGEGPAAYFYVGRSGQPSGAGKRLRDERGNDAPLRKYRGESIALTLPEGITLKDVRWFSIWCDQFSVNFGDIKIPRDVDYPRPARVGALKGVHGVSSDNIVVVDAQTLLIPNFSYDGEAPDAKFWVGRGETPSPAGVRIPDENGKEDPLRRYDRKTIVLTLPGELTIFDIGHFGVWCEAFTVNFGHVVLPKDKLANVPPSLKMLGVSPQSKLNCEVLYDELAFEVRWAVAGDSIVLQLVAKLEDGEYMSFGLSGDDDHTQMVGADVAVAWLDKDTLKGFAQDYYLDAKSQCAGVRGSCPDERLGEKTNSIRLLNAALVNGYSIVTYQRSLKATDELDRAIVTNASQPIVWAIGPLNSKNEVSYHSHFLKTDKFIDFGRPPVWNCPMPETEEDHKEAATSSSPARRPESHEEKKQNSAEVSTSVIKPNPVPTPKPVPKVVPWEIPPIQCYEPADGVLYAQMGPTGGKQGYSAITGHVGWGISWYINGLLIPEINVVRGKKYTFVTEGGSDPSVPARYHPFYITNDPVGGFFHKTDEEKEAVEIYAGVRRTRNGNLVPTGVGRLCNWTPDQQGPDADEYPSFGAYQRSLTLVCEEGNPGVVTWIPDKNTPDTVYYQCFTHRHLGWKINVVDECDESEPDSSQLVESVVAPPSQNEEDLLQGEESIQVPARLPPVNNYLLDHNKRVEKIINTKTPSNDFSNVQNHGKHGERKPPPQRYNSNQSEIELPITTTQIKDVIQAAEMLEHRAQEEYLRNKTNQNQLQQDDFKDLFLPEQPIPEDGEYVIEQKVPSNYMLPPNQKPLTLQAVLGPNGKPSGPIRPHFRRPVPPQIKLRRPPFQRPMSNGYPLPMPGNHGPHPGPMQSHQSALPSHQGPPQSHQGPPQSYQGPPPSHQGPPPSHQGQQPSHQGPPQSHQGPSQSHQSHQGPSQSHQGPSQSHQGPPQSHQGPPQLQQSSPQTHQGPQKSHPGHVQMKKPYGKPARLPVQQQNMNRPPVQIPPMKAMPSHGPSPGFSHQPQKQSNKLPPGLMQSVVMGKPSIVYPTQSQTLSLGKSELIANQVVKSQITLPGSLEPVGQHSIQQNFISKPGQIILGKPMENPMPLDQQMIPTKLLHSVIREPITSLPERKNETPLRSKSDSERPQITQAIDVKPSEFITESSEKSTLFPAVNTGFKPDTIVIESGFKPIIREPLMASEDRITDFDENPNRREDTHMEDEYEESPQPINSHAYTPNEKITESFEPMFIPSPEDTITTNMETKEVFPSNHAKEDRPHPVYVKSKSELNALFSKGNLDKNVASDLAMSPGRISPQYLPPPVHKHKHNVPEKTTEPTIVSYDGKLLSAITLTRVSDDSDVETNPKITKLIQSKPQSVSSSIPDAITKQISGIPTDDAPINNSNDKDLQQKLYNAVKELEKQKHNKEDLQAAGSENNEVIEKKDGDYNEEEEDEYYDETEEDSSRRRRRETQDMQFEEMVSKTNNTKSQDFDSRTVSSSNVLSNSLFNAILVVVLSRLF